MASPQYSFPILPEPAKLITLYTPIWLLNYTSIAVQPPFPSPSPTELHNLHWSKPEGRIRVRPLSALPESSIENEKSRKQSKPFLSIDDILMKKDDKIVKKATNNIKRRAENFDPEDNPMAKQQKLSEAHEKVNNLKHCLTVFFLKGKISIVCSQFFFTEIFHLKASFPLEWRNFNWIFMWECKHHKYFFYTFFMFFHHFFSFSFL